MILSNDITPDRDLYFLGAKVIEILSKEKKQEVDFLDAFEKLRSENGVSINLFTLTLDWLFISGAIEGCENGRIIKCF